jgi:hypothetical protein
LESLPIRTLSPLVAVAVTVNGDCPIVKVDGIEKIIVCEAKVMVIETVTLAAGE